jgi:hypothetical protein
MSDSSNTSQIAVREEILQRRWRWLGHTFIKPTSSVTKHAITWNPQGKRRIGRSKNHMATKCGVRDEETELIMKTVGMTSPGQISLEGFCRWPMHQKRSGRALID